MCVASIRIAVLGAVHMADFFYAWNLRVSHAEKFAWNMRGKHMELIDMSLNSVRFPRNENKVK